MMVLPSVLLSKTDELATVEIVQNKNSFDISIVTTKNSYILEETLDVSVSGKSALLDSVFYQDSELVDGHTVFWNKTKIKIVVNSKIDEKFTIKTIYQICNNLHVCSKLQQNEKSFTISKPIETKKIETIAEGEAKKYIVDSSKNIEEIDLCAKQDICPKISELLQSSDFKANAVNQKRSKSTNSVKEVVSEQDSIVNMIKSSNLLLTLLTFFGFGLLLAFTPCMLPVIPILSAVIISKREHISTKEGFLLSLTYVASMSVVYSLAGIAAASLGSNIQAFFQQTWIIIIFSAFFFLLSLAMFGTFSIEMPKKIQTFLNRKATYGKDRTYYSVIFLGVLSALIVGPCVAPPLAGALIYIGQTGNELVGGLSLFFMSFGMGVPLLLIGAGAGRFIPKPGPWMVEVKLFFGFTMIGFSIWILSRILEPQMVLLLWGILLVAIAIFMNIFENKACASIDSIYHLKKLIALLILMYGIILMVGAIAGANSIKDPLEPFKAKLTRSEIASKVSFKTILSEQLDSAIEESLKPIMVVFVAKWCDNCKELEANVFSHDDAMQELKEFELFKVDITQLSDLDITLLKKYSLFGPPGMIFFDKNKKELEQYRLSGKKEKKIFIEHIQKIKSSL